MSDPEILDSYKLLAECEGVFAEPASAASVAGVLKLAAAGEVKPSDRIVCVLTGHGLKDPQIALDVASDVVPAPNDVREIEKLLDSVVAAAGPTPAAGIRSAGRRTGEDGLTIRLRPNQRSIKLRLLSAAL